MILGFIIVLGFLILGSAIQTLFDLPLPSSILGMLLLFIALILLPKLEELLKPIAQLLQRYLALFFFPLGTILVLDYSPLVNDWQVVLITITLSTAAAIAALGFGTATLRKILGIQSSDKS